MIERCLEKVEMSQQNDSSPVQGDKTNENGGRTEFAIDIENGLVVSMVGVVERSFEAGTAWLNRDLKFVHDS